MWPPLLSGTPARHPRRDKARCKLNVEPLEDRSLPSASFVASLGQPPTLSSPGQFAEMNGDLFFSGNGALQRTDGTAASTTLIRSGSAANLTNVNGTLFFTSGFQLFKSDGTAAGTSLVANLPASATPFLNFTASNGKLFFTAVHPTLGKELWVSDGTEAGTRVVKDILPGSHWSSPEDLIDVNGTLFFTANDRFLGGTFGFAANRELWKSDGTEEGTVKVKEIVPGDASGTFRNVTNVNGTLFFTSGHVSTHGLWKSDGTEAGTVQVLPQSAIAPGGLIGEAVNFNGTLFFTVSNTTFAGSRQLWKSDGTAAGTVLVTTVPGEGSDLIGNLTVVNETLFFAAGQIVFPGVFQPGVFQSSQLWKSDGTAAGTVLVTDRLLISSPQLQSTFVGLNGKLFFTANDGTSGWELWQSDGTDAGTVLVQDVNPGSASAFPLNITGYRPTLKAAGGKLFFAADNGVSGRELWVVTPSASTPVSTVSSVVVNDGSVQRSRVTSITVIFTSDAAVGPDAFALRRQDDSLVGLSVATSVVDGRTVAVLTFTGTDIVADSLADGSYTLLVNGAPQSEFSRLFGDSDGDGDVDDADLALFDSTLGLSVGDPGFLDYFDSDGDGTIDETDLFEFMLRHGVNVPR